MFFRASALALALCLPAFAQPAPPPAPAPSQTEDEAAMIEAVQKTELHVVRNDNEVIVSWVLPKIEPKGLEIFRNTRDQAPGRTRVGKVRAEPPTFYDKVDDTGASYWYWLKITLMNGQTVNVGPVRTPDSRVWTP